MSASTAPGTAAGPLERYREAVREHDLNEDAAQLKAMQRLDTLHADLLRRPPRRQGRLARWLGRRPSTSPVEGVYLWGGVGRGKTMLMDLFFQSLPFDDKLRAHFHRFMNRVHAELKSLGDERDPLDLVAERIATEARVVCFDELFVTDIADAMLLGTLFEALFDRGVALVATSNAHPTELYRDGLQRARFLPAIDALLAHTDVVRVDGGVDYRLRLLERTSVFHYPLGMEADAELARAFEDIAGEGERLEGAIEVLGRPIPVRRAADGTAWFDFPQICDGPRSQNDYIELARCYHTVLVSNVPVLDERLENQARRFVALVDEFYDRRVKLVASAAAAPGELYRGRRLRFEFQRTVSRLQEMQTHEYLAAEHRP